MKIKTSELTGTALDWAVGTANGGLYQSVSARDAFWIWPGEPVKYSKASPAYSTDWAQGGPITDRELISILWRPARSVFWACCNGQDPADEEVMGADGPTPLIAAMRCYVTSKLGDEVDVPDELT